MSEPRALVGLIGANILQSLSPALHARMRSLQPASAAPIT